MVSKIAERLLIPNNCKFVRVPKPNEVVSKNRKILPYHKSVDRRLSDIQKSISLATSAIFQIANETLKSQKESESSFDHKKVVSTAIDAISFMTKSTHSLSAERRDRLKPALNEEVRRLCDLEPTSSEYLFGENMNESLKLAKENYKLSQNLVSTKSRNKAAGPSSRTGFKRRPDHEAGNSFRSRTHQSLNYQGRKRHIHREHHSFRRTSNPGDINSMYKNVSRFDYFWPKLKTYLRNKIKAFKGGCISSKIQEWENITSDKEILKTVEGLTLDSVHEPPSQNSKVMSGQASQNVMVEINKLVGKGVIEYTEHEKGEFISPIFFCLKSDGNRRLILNLKTLNEFLEYNHFKMKIAYSVADLIQAHCYMTSKT